MRWRKLIKDNQKNFSRLHMLIDVFVIAGLLCAGMADPFSGNFEHSAVQSKTVRIYVHADFYYSGLRASLPGF